MTYYHSRTTHDSCKICPRVGVKQINQEDPEDKRSQELPLPIITIPRERRTTPGRRSDRQRSSPIRKQTPDNSSSETPPNS